VRLIKLNDDDEISSVEKIEKMEDASAEAEQNQTIQ